MTTMRPDLARYAIVSEDRPPVIETLYVTDRMIRPALQSLSDSHPVFGGHGDDGHPLEGHGHAFLFCESDPRSPGAISHVTVAARMGFDSVALRALCRLERVWNRSGREFEMFLETLVPHALLASRAQADAPIGLFARATSWVSSTPFVPTRHPKTFRDGRPKLDASGLQIDGPEHELRRQLALLGFPEPVATTRLTARTIDGTRMDWSLFRTHRESKVSLRGAGTPSGPALGFRIVFPEPVQGPVAAGHACHFGLGVFLPDPSLDGTPPR